MIAIVDIDDTVAALVPHLVNVLNKLTGKSLTVNDWTSYDTWDVYGVDQKQYFDLCESEQILSKVSPIPFAQETIDSLYRNEYEIVYLTARAWHNNAYDITMDWLCKHKFKVDQLHILPLHQSKSEYIKANFNLPVDLIVDDNVKHVRGFIENNIAKSVFLIDGPWNRDADDLNGVRIQSIESLRIY